MRAAPIMTEDQGYDVRWRAPTTQMIIGPSGCGKTTFVSQLLKHKAEFFTEDPEIIIFYYKEWQSAYKDMKNSVSGLRMYQGSPDSIEDVKEHLAAAASRQKHKLVIFDDCMSDKLDVISQMFTIYSHHGNTSVLFLAQTAFDTKRPEFRTISVNSKGITLFRNPRDRSVISHLAKQIHPGHGTFLIQAYEAATKSPYSYLHLDFSQSQSDTIRVRSHLFPSEWPIRVYLPPDTVF